RPAAARAAEAALQAEADRDPGAGPDVGRLLEAAAQREGGRGAPLRPDVEPGVGVGRPLLLDGDREIVLDLVEAAAADHARHGAGRVADAERRAQVVHRRAQADAVLPVLGAGVEGA